jgi:hypothetical protein
LIAFLNDLERREILRAKRPDTYTDVHSYPYTLSQPHTNNNTYALHGEMHTDAETASKSGT